MRSLDPQQLDALQLWTISGLHDQPRGAGPAASIVAATAALGAAGGRLVMRFDHLMHGGLADLEAGPLVGRSSASLPNASAASASTCTTAAGGATSWSTSSRAV